MRFQFFSIIKIILWFFPRPYNKAANEVNQKEKKMVDGSEIINSDGTVSLILEFTFFAVNITSTKICLTICADKVDQKWHYRKVIRETRRCQPKDLKCNTYLQYSVLIQRKTIHVDNRHGRIWNVHNTFWYYWIVTHKLRSVLSIMQSKYSSCTSGLE